MPTGEQAGPDGTPPKALNYGGCRTGPQTRSKKYKSLKLRESTFYTHMWGFAEVSGNVFTVLRVYGPILRHSYVSVDMDGVMLHVYLRGGIANPWLQPSRMCISDATIGGATL